MSGRKSGVARAQEGKPCWAELVHEVLSLEAARASWRPSARRIKKVHAQGWDICIDLPQAALVPLIRFRKKSVGCRANIPALRITFFIRLADGLHRGRGGFGRQHFVTSSAQQGFPSGREQLRILRPDIQISPVRSSSNRMSGMALMMPSENSALFQFLLHLLALGDCPASLPTARRNVPSAPQTISQRSCTYLMRPSVISRRCSLS